MATTELVLPLLLLPLQPIAKLSAVPQPLSITAPLKLIRTAVRVLFEAAKTTTLTNKTDVTWHTQTHSHCCCCCCCHSHYFLLLCVSSADLDPHTRENRNRVNCCRRRALHYTVSPSALDSQTHTHALTHTQLRKRRRRRQRKNRFERRTVTYVKCLPLLQFPFIHFTSLLAALQIQMPGSVDDGNPLITCCCCCYRRDVRRLGLQQHLHLEAAGEETRRRWIVRGERKSDYSCSFVCSTDKRMMSIPGISFFFHQCQSLSRL